MDETELRLNALEPLHDVRAELESLRSTLRLKEMELELNREGLDQLHAIEASLGWLLLSKVRGLRARVFRPGTLRGRCYAFLSRFAKTAGTAGFRVAFRKSRETVGRKLRNTLSANRISGTRYVAQVFRPSASGDRFRDLPWKFTRDAPGRARAAGGHFKILLVAHSACRTGAPLCLLRLAEELVRMPDFECFIVLKKGGELADSFAQLAPTLDVEWLAARGNHRHSVPRLIASAFHDFAGGGVAVCNTLAVSEFHAAFREKGVDVLSWIHELPTFISILGGDRAIAEIVLASRRIMVPSEAVRAALNTRFGIDPEQVRTVYNGQDPNTEGLDRQALRLEVRRELGLPHDATIVLGCGTLDLRKGPDVFVNVARRVLLDCASAGDSLFTCFVWVGQRHDENLERWILHDARIDGLEDRIRFIGPRSSVARYYMAADLLALTSREDPCPLVNMEAMESGLPVVAFIGAGGAPEVLADAGICVPYLDARAMANAVRELLSDAPLRQEMGGRGRARIRQRFTWNRFMEEFRDILQADFHYRPAERLRVSVIIPNYRHAKYLEERIQSVFDQTLEPHEIILLDDASPDESVLVARRMASRAKVPMQIVVNEENSGGTFHQWLKGLSLATGDLIWFAESDDSAHPLFLERLVPEFFDRDVVLAYCQSALIGPEGERLADDFLAHTDDISAARWRGRYSVHSSVEAEVALSHKNTIPNASAVVFRRPATIDFASELLTHRFAGDWFFYAMLIRGGKVSFIPEVLNCYRRHEATVSHRSIRDDTQAYESLSVKASIFEAYPVTPRAIAGSLARSVLEYDQLTERLSLERPRISANPHLVDVLDRVRALLEDRLIDRSALRIVLVLGDTTASAENGGLIDLANVLSREHTVFICNAELSFLDEELICRMDARVIPLEAAPSQASWTTCPATGNRERERRSTALKELVRILRIDVLHSDSSPADRLMHEVSLRRPA